MEARVKWNSTTSWTRYLAARMTPKKDFMDGKITVTVDYAKPTQAIADDDETPSEVIPEPT